MRQRKIIRKEDFVLLVSALILSLAFNNCAKVKVSDISKPATSTIAAAGQPASETQPDPSASSMPTAPLSVNCEIAKNSGVLRKVQLSALFENPKLECLWNQDGNLGIKDGYVRARREQYIKQKISEVPTDKITICNIQMTNDLVSNFVYDDNMILTLNGYVLASTTNFKFANLFDNKNGYYAYDWMRLREQPGNLSASDSTPDKQYCAGKDQGSVCIFPETQAQGSVTLDIKKNVIQDILGMTDSSQFELGLVTTGDNDKTDCQHVDINLNMEVDYFIQ